MLKGAKLVSWLNHWLERAGLTYSDLAEVTSRGNSALFRALKGQHGLNEDVFVAILLHLRQVRALSEPGELQYALQEMEISPATFRAMVNQAPGSPAARQEFLTWWASWADRYVNGAQLYSHSPAVYVEREAELRQLKALVLESTAFPVLVWGMGGCGKTYLVRGILEDPQVRSTFWSGVLWATLGPAGQPLDWLSRWCAFLKLPVRSTDDVITLRQKIAQWLAHPAQRWLIVVDDIWEYAALEPLLFFHDRVRLILTTRDRTLITCLPDVMLLNVAAMTEAEALFLLRARAGERQVAAEPPLVSAELLRLVERMPLAVALVGSQVRLRGWQYVSQHLADCHQRLTLLAVGSTDSRETSVRAALELSYTALSLPMQRHFRRLGIYGYENDFRGIAVGELWEVAEYGDLPDTEFEIGVERILWQLYDLSLLESTETTPPRFRLHTLIHDYARQLLYELQEWAEVQAWYIHVQLQLAMRLFPTLESTLAVFTPDWPNLEQAFEYAYAAAQYDMCIDLMSLGHNYLMFSVQPRKLHTWLSRLEPYWAHLSRRCQGGFDHVMTRHLRGLNKWDQAQPYFERVLKNPAIAAVDKGYLCFEAFEAHWQRQQFSAARRLYRLGYKYAQQSGNEKLRLVAIKPKIQLERHDSPSLLPIQELINGAMIALKNAWHLQAGELLLAAAQMLQDDAQFDLAYIILRQVLGIAQRSAASILEYEALLQLYELSFQVANPGAACHIYPRLMELLTQMGSEFPATIARQCYVTYMVALAYWAKRQSPQALAAAQQAVELAAQLPEDPEGWFTLGQQLMAEIRQHTAANQGGEEPESL